MKFLADVNVEKEIVVELRKLKYDIKWVAEENSYLEDTEILKIAHNENRILITNDKDFGEIVFRQKLISSGLILLRVKGQDTGEKIKLINKLLSIKEYSDKIEKHFLVISNNKFRFIMV